MNNKLHIWTEEILEVVRARWTGKQWTATQIAEDLGPPFTRDAIIGRMRTEEHVLVLSCGERSIRFRPSLAVSTAEIDAGCDALERVLTRVEGDR